MCRGCQGSRNADPLHGVQINGPLQALRKGLHVFMMCFHFCCTPPLLLHQVPGMSYHNLLAGLACSRTFRFFFFLFTETHHSNLVLYVDMNIQCIVNKQTNKQISKYIFYFHFGHPRKLDVNC